MDKEEAPATVVKADGLIFDAGLLQKYSSGRHHHMMRMYMLVVGGKDWSAEGQTMDDFLSNVKAVEAHHKRPESQPGCCGIGFDSMPQPFNDVSNWTEDDIRSSIEIDRNELAAVRRELYQLLMADWTIPAAVPAFDGTVSPTASIETGCWKLDLLDPRWETFLAGDCPPAWGPVDADRRHLLKRLLLGIKHERKSQVKRVTHQDMNAFAVSRFLRALSNTSWVPCHVTHDELKELVKTAVFPGFASYARTFIGSINATAGVEVVDRSKVAEFEKILTTIHLTDESKRAKIASVMMPGQETNTSVIDEIASHCIIREQFEGALLLANKESSISHRMSIVLDKEFLDIDDFLANCTFGYEDDTSTLAFPIKYALERVDIFRKMQTCWVFLIPYILLYIGLSTSLLDRPSGYYLIQNVNEHVTNDEILTEVLTGEKDYFPMTFADIANADDFWAWSESNLLNYAFGEDGGVPGWNHKNGGSNHIIGGIRVRSVRQMSTTCDDITQPEDYNFAGVCEEREGSGDPLESTLWQAITPQYATEGGSTTYRPMCLPPKFSYIRPDESMRTLTVANSGRPNSLVAAQIFKYLVEDRLEGVYVNLVQRPALETINGLLSPTKGPNDPLAGIAVWVSDIEAGASQNANGDRTVPDTSELIEYETFGTIDMSTWMSRTVSEFCSLCATNDDAGGWTALQTLANTKKKSFFTDTILQGGFHQPHTSLGWNTPYQSILSQYFVKKETYLPLTTLGSNTYGSYVSELKNLVLNNKNVIFYGDDALGKAMDGMKLKLASTISVTSSIKSFATEELKEKFPDVFQLLHKMKFTDADRDSFFQSQADSILPETAACSWLTANEQTWHPWVRTATDRARQKRAQNYNFKCFGVWKNSDKSGSKTGWLDSTQTMTVKEGIEHVVTMTNALNANTNAPATPADETPAPGHPTDGINVLWRKQVFDVKDQQLLSSSFPVPTYEEFRVMKIAAMAGDTVAYSDWTKREGWVFRSCEDSLSDQILDYYGIVNPHLLDSSTDCGGYTFFLPISKTKSEVTNILDSYRLNNWIDIATRSVIVEFFVHAQNTGQFARFQYSVEFSSEGAAKPSNIFVAFELYHQDRLVYPGFWWIFYAFSWILFVIQVYGTYRLVVRKIEALHLHSTFSKPLRNLTVLVRVLFSDKYFVVDAISYLLIITAGVMRVLTFSEGLTSSNLFCIDVFPQRLDFIADLHYLLIAIEGWVILILWARLFFYVADVVEMDMVMRTMSSAIADLVTLLIVFVILILGFTMAAWGFFGDNLEDYSSLSRAFLSLIYTMMGEFDFKALQDESPRIAATYFALFYIIVNAVWFNLVTSVIAGSYDQCWESRFADDEFSERIQHDDVVAHWGETTAPYTQFFGQIWRSLLWGNTAGRARVLLWGKHFWQRYAVTLERFESAYIDEVMWAYTDFNKIEMMGEISECPESERSDRHTTYEFIADNIGNAYRLRFLEYFCVSVPAMFTQLPLAYEWTKMLSIHSKWKTEQSWIATEEADPIEEGKAEFIQYYFAEKEKRRAKIALPTPTDKSGDMERDEA